MNHFINDKNDLFLQTPFVKLVEVIVEPILYFTNSVRQMHENAMHLERARELEIVIKLKTMKSSSHTCHFIFKERYPKSARKRCPKLAIYSRRRN